MKTADMLTYVQEIGALGGTLTLEYDSGEITLSGDDLIRAAADYEMAEPFTIVPDSEETPWELAEDDGWTPYVPGDLAKVATAVFLATSFLTLGLFLL